MTARCRGVGYSTVEGGIDTDWAACFIGEGSNRDECPHGLTKIEENVCNAYYGKPRVCCFIDPVLTVKVKCYSLIHC